MFPEISFLKSLWNEDTFFLILDLFTSLFEFLLILSSLLFSSSLLELDFDNLLLWLTSISLPILPIGNFNLLIFLGLHVFIVLLLLLILSLLLIRKKLLSISGLISFFEYFFIFVYWILVLNKIFILLLDFLIDLEIIFFGFTIVESLNIFVFLS